MTFSDNGYRQKSWMKIESEHWKDKEHTDKEHR